MNNIFNEILNMSWDASILIIAVIVARLLMRKAPKYFRKLLWGLVGIRLLFPFSVKSVFSLHPGDNISVGGFAMQRSDTQSTVSTELEFAEILPFIWIAVGAALLIYGTLSYIRLKFKISNAVRDKNNIYLSEKVDSPFVCGFLKPKIYFPYNIDADAKSCILLHEQAHIKTGDHIFKAIGFILLCFYWFNPLIWISYFLYCKDIELACDEAVLKGYGEERRKQYAQAIIEIGVNKVRLSACPVAFGEVSIKERVKNALSYKKAGKIIFTISVFACVFVAICFMTEPKAKAQEPTAKPITENIAVPSTTEPVTEPSTTEPVTEPSTTEPVTEVSTEAENEYVNKSNNRQTHAIETAPKYWEALNGPATTQDPEKRKAIDAIKNNHSQDGVDINPENEANVYENHVEDAPTVTQDYNNDYYNNNYNSGYNSNHYSNYGYGLYTYQPQQTTLPVFIWDYGNNPPNKVLR